MVPPAWAQDHLRVKASRESTVEAGLEEALKEEPATPQAPAQANWPAGSWTHPEYTVTLGADGTAVLFAFGQLDQGEDAFLAGEHYARDRKIAGSFAQAIERGDFRSFLNPSTELTVQEQVLRLYADDAALDPFLKRFLPEKPKEFRAARGRIKPLLLELGMGESDFPTLESDLDKLGLLKKEEAGRFVRALEKDLDPQAPSSTETARVRLIADPEAVENFLLRDAYFGSLAQEKRTQAVRRLRMLLRDLYLKKESADSREQTLRERIFELVHQTYLDKPIPLAQMERERQLKQAQQQARARALYLLPRLKRDFQWRVLSIRKLPDQIVSYLTDPRQGFSEESIPADTADRLRQVMAREKNPRRLDLDLLADWVFQATEPELAVSPKRSSEEVGLGWKDSASRKVLKQQKEVVPIGASDAAVARALELASEGRQTTVVLLGAHGAGYAEHLFGENHSRLSVLGISREIETAAELAQNARSVPVESALSDERIVQQVNAVLSARSRLESTMWEEEPAEAAASQPVTAPAAGWWQRWGWAVKPAAVLAASIAALLGGAGLMNSFNPDVDADVAPSADLNAVPPGDWILDFSEPDASPRLVAVEPPPEEPEPEDPLLEEGSALALQPEPIDLAMNIPVGPNLRAIRAESIPPIEVREPPPPPEPAAVVPDLNRLDPQQLADAFRNEGWTILNSPAEMARYLVDLGAKNLQARDSFGAMQGGAIPEISFKGPLAAKGTDFIPLSGELKFRQIPRLVGAGDTEQYTVPHLTTLRMQIDKTMGIAEPARGHALYSRSTYGGRLVSTGMREVSANITLPASESRDLFKPGMPVTVLPLEAVPVDIGTLDAVGIQGQKPGTARWVVVSRGPSRVLALQVGVDLNEVKELAPKGAAAATVRMIPFKPQSAEVAFAGDNGATIGSAPLVIYERTLPRTQLAGGGSPPPPTSVADPDDPASRAVLNYFDPVIAVGDTMVQVHEVAGPDGKGIRSILVVEGVPLDQVQQKPLFTLPALNEALHQTVSREMEHSAPDLQKARIGIRVDLSGLTLNAAGGLDDPADALRPSTWVTFHTDARSPVGSTVWGKPIAVTAEAPRPVPGLENPSEIAAIEAASIGLKRVFVEVQKEKNEYEANRTRDLFYHRAGPAITRPQYELARLESREGNSVLEAQEKLLELFRQIRLTRDETDQRTLWKQVKGATFNWLSERDRYLRARISLQEEWVRLNEELKKKPGGEGHQQDIQRSQVAVRKSQADLQEVRILTALYRDLDELSRIDRFDFIWFMANLQPPDALVMDFIDSIPRPNPTGGPELTDRQQQQAETLITSIRQQVQRLRDLQAERFQIDGELVGPWQEWVSRAAGKGFVPRLEKEKADLLVAWQRVAAAQQRVERADQKQVDAAVEARNREAMAYTAEVRRQREQFADRLDASFSPEARSEAGSNRQIAENQLQQLGTEAGRRALYLELGLPLPPATGAPKVGERTGVTGAQLQKLLHSINEDRLRRGLEQAALEVSNQVRSALEGAQVLSEEFDRILAGPNFPEKGARLQEISNQIGVAFHRAEAGPRLLSSPEGPVEIQYAVAYRGWASRPIPPLPADLAAAEQTIGSPASVPAPDPAVSIGLDDEPDPDRIRQVERQIRQAQRDSLLQENQRLKDQIQWDRTMTGVWERERQGGQFAEITVNNELHKLGRAHVSEARIRANEALIALIDADLSLDPAGFVHDALQFQTARSDHEQDAQVEVARERQRIEQQIQLQFKQMARLARLEFQFPGNAAARSYVTLTKAYLRELEAYREQLVLQQRWYRAYTTHGYPSGTVSVPRSSFSNPDFLAHLLEEAADSGDPGPVFMRVMSRENRGEKVPVRIATGGQWVWKSQPTYVPESRNSSSRWDTGRYAKPKRDGEKWQPSLVRPLFGETADGRQADWVTDAGPKPEYVGSGRYYRLEGGMKIKPQRFRLGDLVRDPTQHPDKLFIFYEEQTAEEKARGIPPQPAYGLIGYVVTEPKKVGDKWEDKEIGWLIRRLPKKLIDQTPLGAPLPFEPDEAGVIGDFYPATDRQGEGLLIPEVREREPLTGRYREVVKESIFKPERVGVPVDLQNIEPAEREAREPWVGKEVIEVRVPSDTRTSRQAAGGLEELQVVVVSPEALSGDETLESWIGRVVERGPRRVLFASPGMAGLEEQLLPLLLETGPVAVHLVGDPSWGEQFKYLVHPWLESGALTVVGRQDSTAGILKALRTLLGGLEDGFSSPAVEQEVWDTLTRGEAA